jgi:hypothetical protein
MVRLLPVVVFLCACLSGSDAWPVNQVPLKKIPVPLPRNNAELSLPQFSGPGGLASYVKDVPAALVLGKALFWEMQAGTSLT